ncbi:MAG: DNA polymerase IV [Granulosicoccus sp.]
MTSKVNKLQADNELVEASPDRKIIHIDMDAFYASVEQRDNPTLRGQPVIVGGQPNGRGVVAACSYEAREFGIHSAMPSAEAGRRCANAVFVKPRFDVYRMVSKQIHEIFREFTDLVEPLSLDEAYLDVTGINLFGGSAVRMAREIRLMITQRTRLIASAGISYNKFLAKIASDHNKPDGQFCVLPGDGENFVGMLPIGRFHGVGKVTESRMHDLGIRVGADLRQWSREELAREFGSSGDYFYRVARGIDHRPVRTSRKRKSMGAERTFGTNISDRDEMLAILQRLAVETLEALTLRELAGTTVSVKVRFPDFATLTRAHSQARGLIDEVSAQRAIPFLLDRALATRARPSVRLLGLSISGLQPLEQSQIEQLELPWPSTE